MKYRESRRERGELALWRVVLVLILGLLTSLVVLGYVVGTIWLIATDGFEGWW